MAVLFHKDRSIRRSAEISECGRYRWWLRRTWKPLHKDVLDTVSKGVCCFVMLNPSTADGTIDDPTIRRCIGFAKAWGYHTLVVRNLFPFRATYPKALLTAEDPTGGARGDQELLAGATADLLVAAWGASVPFQRDDDALALYRQWFPAKPIYCLGTTKSGGPRHPLYVRSKAQPIVYVAAAA